jgi:NarL family two-component system response regulator LiaR
MTDLIRILVADDHMVVRRGLCSLLIPRNGMKVIGEAADGVEAVELAHSLQPDVILMDMLMPRLNGPEAIVEIKKENPDARVLVLTSFGEEDKVAAAIRAGALGYLLKDSSPDELFHAIRSVYRGNLSLPQHLALKLVHDLEHPKDATPPKTSLTAREMDV